MFFWTYETFFAKIMTQQDQTDIFVVMKHCLPKLGQNRIKMLFLEAGCCGGNIAKAYVREPSNPAELANIVDKYLTNIFGSRRNSSKNEQSTQLS